MTESDLIAALRPVTEALEALGVRGYLGGSIASSAHGIARASLDADLIAELELEHVDPFASHLESSYYVPIDHMRAAVAERRSFNLIHLATMFKVDVFVSKGRPYDRQAAGRARPQLFGEAPHDCGFFVASPEDTVLAKLERFRLGGETSERQWWDIVGVLNVADADREYLRLWAPALGVSDLLEKALADTGPPG